MSVDTTVAQKLFTELDLDDRLLKALGDMNLVRMTKVQEQAIPLGLVGKDLIVQARTGSGKTAVYGLILINKILSQAQKTAKTNRKTGTQAIVLVPTIELSAQVSNYLKNLLKYSGKLISVVNGASSATSNAIKALMLEQPEIVVSTPSRVLQHLKDNVLKVNETLETLVIDESDLVLSFGYKGDLLKIAEYLPKVCQNILTSATMPKDVKDFSQLVMRNPVKCFIKDEAENFAGRLSQYAVMCSDRDKFFLMYVVLKLKLISGKCIIFVNGVDRCYRLKLFLEQFSVRSCVLNSELPINSRYHIVEEFNRGVYDYIIATDESAGKDDLDDPSETAELDLKNINNTKEIDDDENKLDNKQAETKSDDKILKKSDTNESDSDNSDSDELDSDVDLSDDESNLSKETLPALKTLDKIESSIKKPKSYTQTHNNKIAGYGVVRGIDFKDAAAVINFDFPSTIDGYIHRIGRTARGNRRGMSLSFVASKAETRTKSESNVISEKNNFEKVKADQISKGCSIEPYEFDMNQISGLRYRCEDALRAVTKASIKEAKLKEIKREILNSELLKTHFEDKVTDLNYLRHDKTLHPTKIQPHLKNIPSYLLPQITSVSGDNTINTSIVAGHKHLGNIPFNSNKKNKRFKSSRGGSKSHRPGKGRSADPLRSFGSGRSKKR
ncbi:hypothetical protein BB561_002803 [Smittium simulii]|uniref:RNA helicase n=1 Tax=Smittium simulii TaxID=133385 RepID=A0A2T9YNZ4_9FUNG|nr:hypothetical protein BB561_002803 [Smittium simulii]